MVKYKAVKTLEVLEGADRYNKWIADTIKPFIVAPALEIGAGTGNISACLTDILPLTLSDTDPDLVATLKNRFKKNQGIDMQTLDIATVKISKKYQTIYSVNVFEHIEFDVKALANCINMLTKGGKLVMLVPAKKYAYTKLDSKLGHFRRYESDELRKKLVSVGFKVESIRYFNALGLLSWIVRDKIGQNDSHLKPYQIKMFDSIVPIVRLLEGIMRPPVGISLIAVAKKI